MDLAAVKRSTGHDITLMGDVDVRLLCDPDPGAGRRGVELCVKEGASGGDYVLATRNSTFAGMNPTPVRGTLHRNREVGRC